MKAFLLLLVLAGCATVEPKQEEKPLGPGEIASAQAASEFLTPEETTKAQVREALGDATAVAFKSGYEVWVYREPPAAELVLLFEPSGILSKKRVRQ